MNTEQLDNLISSLVRRSYKSEVIPKTSALSKDMANVLGSKERQIIRVLKSVVNAIANKLFVERVTVENTTVQDEINRWFKINQFENLQRGLFKAVVRDSEAFILAGFANNAPKYTLIEAYDGNKGAQYIYDGDTVLYAVNVWGKSKYVDIYYTDRIEQYSYTDNEWLLYAEIDWTDKDNAPLGIALIKFDVGDSDIAEAVQLQRDINEAIVDLIAVSRAMGFPQRYTSGKYNPEVVLDKFGDALRSANGSTIAQKFEVVPGSIPHFGENTTLGQLPAAEPDTTVIDKLLHLVSMVTTVPTFYFDGGTMPSGVALIQAETRLNTKVEGHTALLSPSIEQLLLFSAKLQSTYGVIVTIDTDITVSWASPEIYTEDLKIEMDRAEYTKIVTLKDAGLMSIETAVKLLHPTWDQIDIDAEVQRLQIGDVVL